jgi:hypothetical protein
VNAPQSEDTIVIATTLNPREFRALLDWFMCSDPWPVADEPNHQLMTEWLDRLSKVCGYDGWVDAYHRMPCHV